MGESSDKQYGLILPGKSKAEAPRKKPAIFEEDSDSDESPKKPSGISRELKRQEILAQNKAVAEDPTVFQYDELYDEMQEKRNESKLLRKDLDKKPKYINKLLITAEKRKLENDRRIERQMQRELEAEGDRFKDKESFITSAYKKKLEEMKALDEREKREEYLEAVGDVKRQGNLDGFYRHLYEQKVNFDREKEEKIEQMKNKVTSKDDGTAASSVFKGTASQSKKRQYRQTHADSDSDESSDNETKSQAHLACNLDADSDFSIDSDSESKSGSESEEGKSQEKKLKTQDSNDVAQASLESCSTNVVEAKCEEGKVVNGEAAPEKPKVDIWKKRTVGEVFNAAVRRYFERKAASGRGSG